MRILPLSQSFQAKKINLKDYAIFEEPILTNEKIISPQSEYKQIPFPPIPHDSKYYAHLQYTYRS